jgi:hypothetical protein
VRFPPSLPKAVAEVDDVAAEPVLVDEFKIGARVGRQCGVAPTEDDRADEQGELVDQSGDESLCCEARATYQKIPTGGGLHGANDTDDQARKRAGWKAASDSASTRPTRHVRGRWVAVVLSSEIVIQFVRATAGSIDRTTTR